MRSGVQAQVPLSFPTPIKTYEWTLPFDGDIEDGPRRRTVIRRSIDDAIRSMMGIESACYLHAQRPDPELLRQMDEIIAVIAKAQQPDGYIATQVSLRGEVGETHE